MKKGTGEQGRRGRTLLKNLIISFFLFFALAGAMEESRETWDFGGGIFGRWRLDENGLPAYLYTMRLSDPRAVWDPKVFPPTNLQWHQLGNLRLNASAYNLGIVKLFYGESNALWLNEYEPEKGEHAGGFGWLIDGDTVLLDRDDFVPEGAEWEREFGMGYFRKRLRVPGLLWEHRVFAPAGTAPWLVSEETVENPSSRAKRLSLIEYWDVNVKLLAQFLLGGGTKEKAGLERAVAELSLQDGGAMLIVKPPRIYGPHGGFPPRPMLVDPELPEFFLFAETSRPDGWITDGGELFAGSRILRDPETLRRLGREDPNPSPVPVNRLCLAARKTFILQPGEKRTLRFLYGYTKGEDPAALVAAAGRSGVSWPEMVRQWRDLTPALHLSRDAFLGRELAWDFYYFLSASLYHGYYQTHHIPQGANYLYTSGGNGAARDYAAFVQTLTYYHPGLAREVLEFMMRSQEPSGRLFYDLEGFGMRYRVPYRPGDLDLWFIMALTEYVFAARDFSFLDQMVPYYPLHEGKSGPVWEHVQKSFQHLLEEVGVGRHGHPRLRLSDWNDEMMWLTAGPNPLDMIATFAQGESVMNTAMACYIMPSFLELARRRGDSATAAAVQEYLSRMQNALRSAWHDDHLLRSYSGLGRPFGDKEIYLEPQVFTLLAAGVLEPAREEILFRTIVERLKKPSALGMMISTSTSGSLTTRPGEQEEGGAWFAINGPGIVALSRFDPETAWDELIKNTLAWHAHVYPETWFGIWSGPDAWNSVFSDRPAETWYMKTPVMNTGPQMYPVQNAHAHCQIMYALARLAGVSPSAEGWIIHPRFPLPAYSFHCALFDLEISSERIAGRVALPNAADLQLKIKMPPEWKEEKVVARTAGREIRPLFAEDFIILFLSSASAPPVDWEIRRELKP